MRRAYDAFKACDIDLLTSLTSPDFVLRSSSAVDGAEHRGPQAMREVMDVIRGRWQEFRVEPLEFYEAGNRVLVLGTLITKGRTEEGLVSTAGQVWTLKDGQIVALDAFLDTEEAIRASGLTRLLT